MDNRFIIIVGSYNNEQWVESNIQSIISQDHSNYKVLYFIDYSIDKTLEEAEKIVGNNEKFNLIFSKERKYKTWFFYHLETFEEINDNDILVFLDGDDFLTSENVLSYLNSIYNQTECWMTYGGMRVWDGEEMKEPFPQNSETPYEIRSSRNYRKDMWRYSHLKSMRGFLWKKFRKNDLLPEGKFDACQDDLAIMFGMLEMCPQDKIYRVTDPIYAYNGSIENGYSRGCTELKNKSHLENIIRNYPPYSICTTIRPFLAGGLGNQMFEIAAAASLAKDNNAVLVVNPGTHICPNQGRNISTYLPNVFSRILLQSQTANEEMFEQRGSTYEKIPFSGKNLHTKGHFQSWKYFHHNEEYIKDLFKPTHEIIEYLHEKYPFASSSIGIQIRRGDYIKFPDCHPILPKQYFEDAIFQSVPGTKTFIFSDDIDWCKENFSNLKEVTFVKEEDYLELYLMAQCKNLIISNSSFGWWGAYLNTNVNHKIFVPSQWFGSTIIQQGFKLEDIILPEWNIIKIK